MYKFSLFYTPPCGICEGYGGIPYGDENDKITLTTCKPIANASNITNPVKPVWGAQFTAKNYNEVLIGPKTDPFCFNSFPSNSSIGKLCYRKDSGRQVYDLQTSHALREDLNVETPVGNITSRIIHQGKNFWVINHLPWYALGVHQCICTAVHQGGDPSSPSLYPIAYNWTNQMFYIGREEVGIEFNDPPVKEVLEHWAFGPHHVWSKIGTGEIRRMWQPYNGLQVFEHGTSNHTIDPTLFDDIPPTLCKKKGGATFRIKCSDDGYPTNGTTKASGPNTSKKDLYRAKQKKPRSNYRGDTFPDMSRTLNRWLKSRKVDTRSCDTFSAKELQKLQALLYLARDVSLDSIYVASNDNRKLRSNDIELLMNDWKHLNNEIENHDDKEILHTIQRDGHCHETVMWWVHHLNEDMKRILQETTSITIPYLSENSHVNMCTSKDSTYKKVCRNYEEQVTCASCHSNYLPPGHDFLNQKF